MNGDTKRLLKLLVLPLRSCLQNLPRFLQEVSWLARRGGIRERYVQSHAVRKLNIGCGANILPGWLNADFVPGSPDAIFLEATQTYPLATDSFDRVFAEHMIEHVPYDQALQMLRECHRILKPGGRIRIATPDLAKMLGLFAEHRTTEQSTYLNWFIDKFAHSEEVRVFHPTFVLNKMVREWGHQFIYDAFAPAGALQRAGFKDCSRWRTGESADPALRGIDGHNTVSGSDMNAFETLAMESIK